MKMTIELLNIDCMEYMAEQPDGAFDLAIVDPPYGINVNISMGRRKGDNKSDYHKYATQKPVALYEWLLHNYAQKGHRIIDTHLGSGSSAIAAHYFGCDLVGCELDAKYYELAKERFDRETAQRALFG